MLLAALRSILIAIDSSLSICLSYCQRRDLHPFDSSLILPELCPSVNKQRRIICRFLRLAILLTTSLGWLSMANSIYSIDYCAINALETAILRSGSMVSFWSMFRTTHPLRKPIGYAIVAMSDIRPFFSMQRRLRTRRSIYTPPIDWRRLGTRLWIMHRLRRQRQLRPCSLEPLNVHEYHYRGSNLSACLAALYLISMVATSLGRSNRSWQID